MAFQTKRIASGNSEISRVMDHYINELVRGRLTRARRIGDRLTLKDRIGGAEESITRLEWKSRRGKEFDGNLFEAFRMTLPVASASMPMEGRMSVRISRRIGAVRKELGTLRRMQNNA